MYVCMYVCNSLRVCVWIDFLFPPATLNLTKKRLLKQRGEQNYKLFHHVARQVD